MARIGSFVVRRIADEADALLSETAANRYPRKNDDRRPLTQVRRDLQRARHARSRRARGDRPVRNDRTSFKF